MSRIRCIILALFLLTAWFGCSQGQSETEGQEGQAKGGAASPSIASVSDSPDAGNAKAPSSSVTAEASTAEAQGSPEERKKPKIEFENSKFDFGEIEAGEKVEHVFTFKNMGDAPLIIEKVKSS